MTTGDKPQGTAENKNSLTETDMVWHTVTTLAWIFEICPKKTGKEWLLLDYGRRPLFA